MSTDALTTLVGEGIAVVAVVALASMVIVYLRSRQP